MTSVANSQHDTLFWREIAIAHSQVAANNARRITVQSEGEGLVAYIFWDDPTKSVMVSVMVKTGTRKAVVTDATDRS